MEKEQEKMHIVEGVALTDQEMRCYNLLKDFLESDYKENADAFTKDLDELCKKYPLYSQDGKGGDAMIIARYFIGDANWYVLEVGKEGNDYTFFGIVDLHNGLKPEYGYFRLSELQQEFKVTMVINNEKAVKIPMHVSRSNFWEATSVADSNVLNNY